jgi:hypothetical protein
VSLPLGLLLLGGPIGVAAVVISLAGGPGARRPPIAVVGRVLGIGGVLLAVMELCFVIGAA